MCSIASTGKSLSPGVSSLGNALLTRQGSERDIFIARKRPTRTTWQQQVSRQLNRQILYGRERGAGGGGRNERCLSRECDVTVLSIKPTGGRKIRMEVFARIPGKLCRANASSKCVVSRNRAAECKRWKSVTAISTLATEIAKEPNTAALEKLRPCPSRVPFKTGTCAWTSPREVNCQQRPEGCEEGVLFFSLITFSPRSPPPRNPPPGTYMISMMLIEHFLGLRQRRLLGPSESCTAEAQYARLTSKQTNAFV